MRDAFFDGNIVIDLSFPRDFCFYIDRVVMSCKLKFMKSVTRKQYQHSCNINYVYSN